MNFKKVISAATDSPQKSSDSSAPSKESSAPSSSAPAAPASSSKSSSFGSSSASSAPASSASTGGGQNKLSSDVEIKGKVRFKDGLIVDGKIEGEIESNGSLTVQPNARIKAEIRTRSIIVEGKVHGNITVTEHARIAKSAEVVGDIKAATLEIESGATFVGKSAVGTPSIAPANSNQAKSNKVA